MKSIVQGDWRIEFQTRKTVDIMGRKKTYPEPITFPVLIHKHRVVMSESPQEVIMMKNEAKGAKGRCLVGGLGLGLILEHLRKRKGVKEIVVVERQPEVIHLYRQLRKDKVRYDEVINSTIEDYLKRDNLRPFDYVHLDTWYTGDYEHLPHVNWLVAQAKKNLNPKGVVQAWNHKSMRETFKDECAKIVSLMKNDIVHGPDYKIEALKRAFPLLGGFIGWYRENHKADRGTLISKILELADQSFEFEHKPEVQDEIRIATCMAEGIPCPPGR